MGPITFFEFLRGAKDIWKLEKEIHKKLTKLFGAAHIVRLEC
jgi:hypothetical protein